MPYKDINKRREAIRKSVAKLRAKRKGITYDDNVNPIIPKQGNKEVNPQKGFTKEEKFTQIYELINQEKNERMSFQNEIREWSQNITEIINNFRTTGKKKNETNNQKQTARKKTFQEKSPREKPEKKPLADNEKIKVDTAELEKHTGIKKD
ncbi:6971_t:CDS:2 [Racocetra fulgida]|uniref:6971_t:CDS:1 n=1 Tax=Racocetra fulgida TaxID=60492 RepID=A0A9N9J4G0_9GLOM|nr:6971_t:CDS:2 [Racocetra fulgida]